MKSQHFLSTAIALGFFLSAWDLAQAQTNPPNTITLTAKVRDFAELPNAAGSCTGPYCPNHPDFNTTNGDCRDAVETLIDTTGAVNATVFAFDNRNPKVKKTGGAGCPTSTNAFLDWFNDKTTSALPDQNRPFLYDMVFNRNAQGMYEYINSNFFPLDNDSVTQGKVRRYAGGATATFGHLNTAVNGSVNTALHNYGFTTEFHAAFTYIASESNPQVFNFTGDDDVWVFINGKRVIDLGGVHAAEDASVRLDAATIANYGLNLENGKSYMLDFFLAERRIFASNCRITTSLQLQTQTVAPPDATPGTSSFKSSLSVLLTDATPGATIYYTTNGSDPDTTDPKQIYSGAIPINTTTTVKAIAIKTGWNHSEISRFTYTKQVTPSILEVLAEDGTTLPGFLSEANKAYKVKVSTTQAGLGATSSANASTQVAADKETVALTTDGIPQNDYIVYTGNKPLAIGAATLNDNITQGSVYDSLIVKWVNPKDPADVAEKHVLIRPAKKEAQVFFATDSTGATRTTQYAGTEGQLYVFVSDEVLPAGMQPTITLTSTRPPATAVLDTLTLNLTKTATPGLYRAIVTVDNISVTAKADTKLQILINDNIKASYTDPMDGDAGSANAGYGSAPEIDATLKFTDKNWVPVPNGTYYVPTEGALYLQYTDDFIVSDTVRVVTLTIVNNKGGAKPDSESFSLKLNLAKRSGSTGIWEGSIKLVDGPRIVKNNDTAETYVLGEAHATVIPHSKDGTALARISDDLLVAYPDQDPNISIEGGGGPNASVTRADTGLTVIIKDQSLSTAIDTIYFNISCTGSGDAIPGQVMAVETSAGSGIYQSTIITKAEGSANPADGKLQCLSHDFVRVTYSDTVYGKPKSVQKEINEPVTPKLAFSSDPAGQNAITAISDADADSFYVVVTARNANINAVDNLPVTLNIGAIEKETFTAVETGPATNVFIAKVPFKFVTGAQTPNNQVLEGKITADNASNLVTAIGSVTVDGSTATGNIDLLAAFDKVVKAYIKDTDGDGKGDKVYIVFENRLSRTPASVIAHWNSDAQPAKTADKAKIGFLNSDSNVVVLDFTSNEFPQFQTAADPLSPPTATLPSDALFKGQQPVIEDSIGPLITKAVKHPANPNVAVKGDLTWNRDTLYVTLSEPLKNADFKQMIKAGASCSDYSQARVITAAEQPTTVPGDPNTYVILIDRNTSSSPTAGSECVFLNADGKYTDNYSNLPPRHGVELGGSNGVPMIELVRGYPPVAGLSPKNPSFMISVQDNHDKDKGGYAQQTAGGYTVFWYPPVGFDPAHPSDFRPYTANVNDLLPSTPEIQDSVSIPENISTLQVVSDDPYIAHITIYDNLGNFVKKSVQAFGFRGEMANAKRQTNKGKVSYLVWDTRDTRGQLAANGVYVWKVQFLFKGGKQQVEYTRTGLFRKQ